MPTSPTITVNRRHAFGRAMIYPLCAEARRLAAKAGTKTLSESVIQESRDAGFVVVEYLEGLAPDAVA